MQDIVIIFSKYHSMKIYKLAEDDQKTFPPTLDALVFLQDDKCWALVMQDDGSIKMQECDGHALQVFLETAKMDDE